MTDPIKQRSKKFFLNISGHQQRWSRPLPGAILIPPALLVVADYDGWGFQRIKCLQMPGIWRSAEKIFKIS